MPKIIGDGVHDDGPGLQALLDGQKCAVESDAVGFKNGFLVARYVRIDTPLVVTRNSPHGSISCCPPFTIEARDGRTIEARGLSVVF